MSPWESKLNIPVVLFVWEMAGNSKSDGVTDLPLGLRTEPERCWPPHVTQGT
jgi:hypothetical protein